MAHKPAKPEQLRARLERLEGEKRAEVALELGELLVDEGDYAEALVHLAAARRLLPSGPRLRRVELAIGSALHRRGEDDRAAAHLERVAAARDADLEAAARAQLGEIWRRRGDRARAAELLEAAAGEDAPPDARARALTGLSRLALDEGNAARAFERAERATRCAPPAALAEARLAIAEAQLARGDAAAAVRTCRLAIEAAAAFRRGRELAEAYFGHARILGASGLPSDEPPAAWLARALELYREHGSAADLDRVRQAFRRLGRRATDHIAAPEVDAVIAGMREARRAIAEEAFRIVDDPRRGRGDEALAAGLDAMADAEARLVSTLQTVIVERESIRTLLELTRSLNTLSDSQRLLSQVAKMAAQLTSADRAVVAIFEGGALEVAAALGFVDASKEAGWRAVVDEVLRGGGQRVVESAEQRGGEPARVSQALALPLRQADRLFGALYVDKELGGGVFSSRDLDLLAIFCAQAATMLANVRAAEELRLSTRSRLATLEAISDALVSFDEKGEVNAFNVAAARLLGLPADAPVRSFLRLVVTRGEEIDGRALRIGPSELVVTIKLIRDGDRGDRLGGGVATFTEMKRAQSIAQRLVGSSARYSFHDLLGRAPSLRACLALAEAAARSDSTVLVSGESGTGKEVLAQAIHNASPRASGPFVGINCSAIPRELLESELFGYEGGAFTGAKRGGQPGKFEIADSGTLLLDEIGDMPIEMQAKLLRVLQERSVQRIGGTRDLPLDARIIATTNRDLAEAVARGQFRSDLYFRLKVIHIALPPLRERKSDVPLLVEHFLALFAARFGKRVRAVAAPVMDAFERYPWPGNIRELENVLEAEVNLIDPAETTLDRVPSALAAPPPPSAREPLSTLEDAERKLLVQALVRHGGAVPEVARTLGVSRGTVYNKLHRYALDPAAFRHKS